MIICAVVMISLLVIEIRGKKRFVLFDYLISWVPLSAFLMIDLLDIYLHIPGGAHLWFGLAVTTIYQMVRFAWISAVSIKRLFIISRYSASFTKQRSA